ncbi:BatD family protein [Wenyingzhuangia sp. 2_MG-2023]|uniref:BatD family protein n=1 Tax=Wenyingzhuangia sp. 2_MG-2023 TaxID=3062639 RepID=UPI0026E2E457|nr:BatD family protein [Wenyingzhuangia sp. 2_MG-2023]MDO6736660.1 BatD family protein [Wenyingzhuangia sp. 2_MG-2023]
MKKTGNTFLFKSIFLLLFLVSANIVAQVELKASVSKKTLGENQRLRLEYQINNQEADDFKLPNFKNFKVVQGPSQSVSNSYSITNGKLKSNFSKTYTYILEPKRKGTFTLPPASIEYKGDRIESNAITINVVDPVDIPVNPNDPNYIASQNVKMVVTISNETPYVGEPIYAEYRLYVNQMGINGFDVDTPPNYEGFWSQNIENKRPQFRDGDFKGEQWQYAVLHKVLLIPQREGKLNVNSMSADIVVAVPTGRGDFFGNMISRNVNQKLASEQRTIQVKPLPLEGKPLDFTGAVGTYSYDVNTSRAVFKANESAQIKVKVEGKGNIKLFEIPAIKTPKELEVYDPERKEKVAVTSSGMSGSLENAYTVVPQYKGKFIIPSTTFSYFNPKDEKYHTITSDEIVLDVTEGKELVATASEDFTSGTIKQTVKATGNDFRYIQTTTNLEPIEKEDFYASKLFYILLLLPFFVLPLGIFASQKQRELSKDKTRNKLKNADKLTKKYLTSARKELGNKETFYSSLEKALHNYLKAKLSVETTDISKDKIVDMLESRGVSKEITTQFIEVFSACEFARYAPSSEEKMKEDFEKAKQAITLIDKNL